MFEMFIKLLNVGYYVRKIVNKPAGQEQTEEAYLDNLSLMKMLLNTYPVGREQWPQLAAHAESMWKSQADDKQD